MKANRWLCLLLAICLVFTLTACGGGGGSDDNNDADTWPVEFYRSTGGSSVSAMRVAPATGSYKYIYFYENGTYKSGDLNNGTLTQTGSGTYTGGDPHGIVTLILTGTYEGNTISGKTVVISSSSLTIDGQTFARSDSNTTPGGGGNGGGGNKGGGGSGGGGGAGYPVSLNPLCFTANTAGSTIKLKAHDYFPPSSIPTVQYSTDGENWNSYILNTLINLEHPGDKVYFRGDNGSFCDEDGNMNFVMDGSIAASGNIMSLLDKTCELTTIPNAWCFYYLFNSCNALTTAPELPATVLKNGCYASMFNGCASLTVAPELPAATLESACYENMFYMCSSLETVPLIAATTLLIYSCDGMFSECNNLNSITVNFTGWSGDATDYWVKNVAATGDFYCPATLATGAPGDFGDSKVPAGWTVHNP
ncbi:MAG: hypothetical protein IKO95_03235 [Spirochaetia bacterium]|nr:hypothetical protein [Spirochaetia bacterium]